MKIIRDDGFMGNIFTTALGIDWGIRRCNIKGCYETTLGAVVCDPENEITYGLCEYHYNYIHDNTQHESMSIELDFTPLYIARWIDRIEANEHAEYAGEWMRH